MSSLLSQNENSRGPRKRSKYKAVRIVIFVVICLFVVSSLVKRFSSNVKTADASASLSPLNGQKVWIDGQELFRFEWSVQTDDASIIEVARDSEFQDVVIESEAPKSPFVTDKLPGEGDYFYRLVQKSGDQVQVLLQPVHFTVVTKAAPQLIYPFEPTTSEDGKPLRFYWQPKHGVARYHVQVSFDKGFKNIFSDFSSEETKTAPQNIPAGDFFWRVRAENDETSTSNWSETRTLHIQKGAASSEDVGDAPAPAPVEAAAPAAKPEAKTVAKLEAPPPPVATPKPVAKAPIAEKPKPKPTPEEKVLTSPVVAQTVQKETLSFVSKKHGRHPASVHGNLENPPALAWKKVKDAASYEVQVSKKANFSKLEWTKIVTGNQAVWDEAKPGHYFWRVRAQDDKDKKGPFAITSTLDLNLAAPKMKKSFSHHVKVKTKVALAAPVAIDIDWEKVPGSKGYRLIVADNENFSSNILDTKVDDNAGTVSLVEGGTYFLKVAALGPDGDMVSEFSNVATLNFEKENKIPAPKEKKKVKASKSVAAKERDEEPEEEAPAPPAKKARAPAAVIEKANILPIPKPKFPLNGISIVSLSGAQDPISFKWEAVPTAELYRLEIASDGAFKHVIHSAASHENQTVVMKAMPKGKLYWRIRAELGTDKSAWSQVFYFER